MLKKKISGLFWFITDQGKTRMRREKRRGWGGGGSVGENAAKSPSVLPWFGLNPAFQCTAVL